MSKRREQELAQPNEQYLGRTLHRVYAALYNNVPWLAVIAVCLYLPGIVLWAVFALHCKADTFLFLTTIAPVAPETVDGVSNLVNTTLIALITTATCLFMLALVLAIARSVQKAGAAPNSSFPCVRNSPSSYYLYRVFNLGYNFIVFFVNMFIVFLMMGAFLWLVVAYGANLSIKGGVLDAATNGFRPLQQYNLARQNYTTVVSYYEQQVKNTPPCVRNTTWFKGINSSIASILKPPGGNDTSPGNTVLCPQSCLNLGSWATLFKLTSNCICEQTKLYQLQQHSLAVATDAGVALGGLILIYFGSCCMHAYLISERVHAGYDYRKAKRIASRRQQLGPSSSSIDNPRGGADKGPHNGGSGPGGGRGDGGDQGDGAAHHVIAMNGSGYPPDPGPDGVDRSTSTVVQTSSHGQHGHVHHRSNSSSSAHESVARGAAGESRGGSFSAVEDVRALQQAVGAADRSLAGNGHMGVAAGAAAGALAAAAAAAAAAASGSGAPTGTGSFTDTSPFVAVAAEGSLQQQQQGGVQGVDGFSHLHQQQRLHRHHRVSSGGGSSSSPISAASRQLQRVPSPLNAGRSAAAAAAGLSTHSSAPGSQGVGGLYLNDSVHGHGHRGSGSRVTDWQQQQQQHHDHIRAASPPASLAAAWSAHGRSESRSSTSSIRDLLSGAIPLDQFGHVPRMGLTPTSSGNAAAAVAAIQQQQQLQRVSVIQEVPGSVSTAAGAAGAAAAAAALPAAGSSGGSGGPQKCTHRRDDSQQSNSSSSSYGTVVCHSPRSSEPDNSSSVAQSVLQASAAAAAAPGAFCSGSLGGRAAAGGVAGTLAHQQAAAAVEGADTQVPAAPIAVGATVDGEEALSGSRTGSWSRKQAHRRLPALDFTTAAPALWLAKDGDQQQQQQQMPAEGPQQQQQQQQQQVPAEWPQQQQQQQQQLAASTTAGAAPQAQQEHVHADRTSTLASVAAAGAAALAGAGAAAAAHGFASADGGDGGEGGAVDRAARAPVRRHIALDGSSTAQQDFIQHGDVSMQPQEQASPQQQQQQQAARSGDAQQQQQQQGLGQIPSMAAVAAMLQPSPEPNKQEQEQQQQQELQQGLQDVASFEAEQQQRARQRPPYSLLLLPPEQHELMLKQQQQQLQALLQQAQEEEQQQPQQHAWTPHHRQWSTSSLSLAASNSSTGSPGPTGAYLRQPQQQPQLHQQHHHHSYSTPNVAAAAEFGSGVSPQGLGGMGGGFGAGTAAAAAGPRASYGSMQRSLVPSLAGLGGPMQQQQQQGGLLPGSFGSSSGGGVRFAGNVSANGDDESSPGDGTSSVTSRSYAALHTPRSFAAGGTAAGVAGSTAGGSVVSSLYNTPQATPHSSPAPLRSLSGRMTPAGNTQSAGGGQYGGQYPGNLFVGGSSGGAAMAGGSSSSSWGQLPQGSMLTTSSSYSGSANAPGYGGGLNNLLMSQASLGTPRSVLSPLGREEVLPLQGSVSGYGLLNPGGVVSSSGVQGSSVLAIPPIPEMTPGEGLEIEPVGGPLGANGAAAAAGGGDAGVQQQQQDVVMESPLERRRSGYRSSMRKGLMAYDQYKHRQRYQDALTQPLDPGSELARRYRSRMPAI